MRLQWNKKIQGSITNLNFPKMIEINNLTKTKIDEDFLKGLAKKVLKSENGEKEDLSIAFVGEQRIKKINKKYRKQDKPTDVLSFEGGEILLCLSQIGKNAKKHKVTFKKELAHVLIHGILHNLGYNHSKEMQEKEQRWQNNT